MANLVNGAVFRYWLDVTIASLDNNSAVYTRTKSYEFAAGVQLYADALAAAGAHLTALAAITEGDIVAYSLRVVFKTRTAPPSVVGNVYKVAALTLDEASGLKKLSHDIFSPYDAMVSGKNVVTTAALQTYLNSFMTGGDFTMSDGDVISTDEATRILTAKIRMDSLSAR
jgi:hypothetical protein